MQEQTPSQSKSTLLIRPGALGDAVLSIPAVHAAHAANKTAISVLGTRASWSFLRPDTPVTVLEFGASEWLGLFNAQASLGARAAETLAETQAVVGWLTGDAEALRETLFKYGVQDCKIFAPPLAEPFLSRSAGSDPYQVSLFAIPPEHAARRLCDPFGCTPGPDAACFIGEDPLLRLLPEEDAAAAAFLNECAPAHDKMRRLIGLHPGSGGRKKCWSPAAYAELATRIYDQAGAQPLIFGGPADDEMLSVMLLNLPPHVPKLVVEKRSLREVLALLNCCAGYIGNDSGLTHLAARACPVLALFGPTDPRVWAPLGPRVFILEAPAGALNKLTPERVFVAAKQAFAI